MFLSQMGASEWGRAGEPDGPLDSGPARKEAIMSLTLDEMIEVARRHKMTPTEKGAQRVSLIMGLKSHKSSLTREQVQDAIGVSGAAAEEKSA